MKPALRILRPGDVMPLTHEAAPVARPTPIADAIRAEARSLVERGQAMFARWRELTEQARCRTGAEKLALEQRASGLYGRMDDIKNLAAGMEAAAQIAEKKEAK